MKSRNTRLTDDQRAELAALQELPDDQIDTTDVDIRSHTPYPIPID